MDASRAHSAIERIRHLLGPRFEELAGAHLHGEIPLTSAVLNALISERLHGSTTPVQSAELRVAGNNEVFVRVRLRKPAFMPPVVIGARVDQQPQLPHSPVLGLEWWLPGMGVLGAMAAPVLSWLKAGPPWMTMDGRRVFVDLASLLRERGAGEALAYLRALRIETREGVVIVRFEARVDAPLDANVARDIGSINRPASQ